MRDNAGHNFDTGDEKPAGRSTAPHANEKKRGGKFNDVITGDILSSERFRKWYPLAIWCSLLIFLYIAQVFRYQRTQREEISAGIELNEERARALVFSSMKMNASRRSVIVYEVKRRGITLEEPKLPPKKVK